MATGSLFVISAPSGTGKTTILRRLIGPIPKLVFSVSHTTREPRKGEVNGVDYHFVGTEEFEKMIEEGQFVEHANVHGNLYGTSKAGILHQLEQGFDVVLDIDVQGAAIIREAGELSAQFIFIAPPSLEELERRLRSRGTESEDRLALRMANAREELQQVEKYDYLIINEKLDEATDTLRSVIVAERARNRRSPSGENISMIGEQ